MAQYLSVVELSSLDGNNGFKINGEAASDESGFSVSSAGDVNDDGYDDFIVAAKFADPNGLQSGTSYLVFGKASSFGADFALSGLDGTNGFKFNGEATKDYSGRSVSSAGDLNGDGFDDLIIGAYGADPNGGYTGASYIVFGGAHLAALDAADGASDGTIELSQIDGTDGFQINGVAINDISGWSVSAAGDIDGDTFDDLIIGANGADPHGSYSGASYVLFGGSHLAAIDAADGTTDGNIQLSEIDGTHGYRFKGEFPGDQAGFSVSSAGDINGDGIDDLVVGALGYLYGASFGASYIVFGGHLAALDAADSSTDGSIDLSNVGGSDGFKIVGEAVGDRSACSVSSAGDFNGDGIADLIVGAYGADPNGSYSGASYVVFGGAYLAALDAADGTADGAVDMTLLDGTDGFKINGGDTLDRFGFSVSSAGDFNGDGFDDIIVGAKFADPNGLSSGAAYVVFGAASGFGATLELSALDGNNGFAINGEVAYDNAGASVSSAGDINGDGFADLIVGAYGVDANGASPGGELTGASYVIYGAMPGEAVTRTGTATANTIHGGDFDDRLSGWGGDDTLYGHGGKDVITGGLGNDVLVGGAGKDLLAGYRGSDVFVFQAVSDSTGSSFDTIKAFDFTSDTFDIPAAITGIDSEIVSGLLRGGHFDADLAAATAADAGDLHAHHAILFTPDSGGKAGKTFLIVDVNGVVGYQAGADIVVNLANAQHLASIDTGDFI